MSESPVEAWLGQVDTQQDIAKAQAHFGVQASEFEAACFVLGIHILALLEFQQQPEPDPEPEPGELPYEDEDDEPWRKR